MAIHRIILLKPEPGIAPAEIESVRENLHSLPSRVPAISGIQAGQKIKHPLDHDFDEGVILIFKDEDALKSYDSPHPEHRKSQEYTAAYIQEVQIFDIHVKE